LPVVSSPTYQSTLRISRVGGSGSRVCLTM
jgi:hypothetical protein